MAAGSRGKETIMNPETLELKEKRGRQVGRALRFIVIMLGVSFLLAGVVIGWNATRVQPHGWGAFRESCSLFLLMFVGSCCILGGKSLT